MEEKKKRSFLRWPWNVVIYVLLAVVFRIFSIPIILFLVWYQQKNNPHGIAEGYCLSRTRKHLSWLLWSLLLFLSVCLAVYFLDGMKTDRGHWETNDYVTLIISAGGTVVLAAAGVYMTYAALRDTFFPERSALAQSIRSQLPYPDEAPEVAKLFHMVDSDLKKNGQWFGPVGIGKEWVLGDMANRIDRIRGIFVVDRLRVRSSGGRTQSSRTLELVLIDDRWQKSVTAFRDPGDLQAAADCLALRVPDARRGKNDQYVNFLQMDESQREEFERDFRQKQNRRASAQALQESMNGPQDMILKCSNGEVTSRVSVSLVEDTLKRCLAGEETGFELIPTRPGGPELEFYIAKMPPRRAAEWLTGYPGGEYLPGGPEWKNITKQMKKRK